MKKILLGILLACCCSSGAQVVFQKEYGAPGFYDELCYSLQITPDNGYILCGGTCNYYGAGSCDLYMIKTDTQGNILWAKTFGGTGSEVGSHVENTADKGFIAAGYSYGFTSDTLSDIYLVKTDSSGNLMWSKTYGGTGNDNAVSVKETFDGGYVIAGTTRSFSFGYEDVYIIKTDILGNVMWTRTFGGTGYEITSEIIQTADSGFAIIGSTSGMGPGAHGILLIKTDGSGNNLWTKTYSGSAGDQGYAIRETANKDLIITGSTSSFGNTNSGYPNFCLMKTDLVGTPKWFKVYSSTIYGTNNFGASLIETNSGYAIAGGYAENTAPAGGMYLFSTDTNGVFLWGKKYGGGVAGDVHRTPDGGFILGGRTDFDNNTDYDIYLIKTDSNGNSGCNQGNPPISENSPVINSISFIPMNSLGGTLTNPPTIADSGGTETIICISVVSVVNVMNSSDNSIFISPNPFSCEARVKLSDHALHDTKLEFKMYNVFGEEIQAHIIRDETGFTIRRGKLPSGIYFFTVSDNEKVRGTGIAIID